MPMAKKQRGLFILEIVVSAGILALVMLVLGRGVIFRINRFSRSERQLSLVQDLFSKFYLGRDISFDPAALLVKGDVVNAPEVISADSELKTLKPHLILVKASVDGQKFLFFKRVNDEQV